MPPTEPFTLSLVEAPRTAANAAPAAEPRPPAPQAGCVDARQVTEARHLDERAVLQMALDVADGDLERAGADDDPALLAQDPGHPLHRLGGLLGGLHGEDVVVLVLEVARLVGPQPRESVRDR